MQFACGFFACPLALWYILMYNIEKERLNEEGKIP
jgi:hypothetical protein